MSQQTAHLARIFQAGLHRVDPYRMIADHVRLDGSRLLTSFDGEHRSTNLDDFQDIVVLGAGKASARMARAFEDILGDRISHGLVAVKYGHAEPLAHIEVVESGHPVPDAQGLAASERMRAIIKEATAQTLAINLISGGGSAILPAPLAIDTPDANIRVTLEDKRRMTDSLLACGAAIDEINCVRKHISGLKGGRFLRLLAPARSLNFILSDVVGDRLDTIASGLTSPDPTTFADALRILAKYSLTPDLIPPSVAQTLTLGSQGRISETLKPSEPAAALADNIIIGSNRAALLAACETARALGYATIPLTSGLTGEAREAARFFYGIARDTRDGGLLAYPPACIIAGGETVVTLRGQGQGGRNQEMALAFLLELARDERSGQDIAFLSASTDGSDGPTDAAGAFATSDILAAAYARNLDPLTYLRNNDSYNFFDHTDGLLRTGPTMTNVCDLHILLVGQV